MIEVHDEIKGIGSVVRVMSTPDVVIFLIDHNSILTGVTPHWHLSFGPCIRGRSKCEFARLVWIDPRWKKRAKGKIKTAWVEFGRKFRNNGYLRHVLEGGYAVITEATKGHTSVVFYRRKFLARACSRKPLYEGPIA